MLNANPVVLKKGTKPCDSAELALVSQKPCKVRAEP